MQQDPNQPQGGYNPYMNDPTQWQPGAQQTPPGAWPQQDPMQWQQPYRGCIFGGICPPM